MEWSTPNKKYSINPTTNPLLYDGGLASFISKIAKESRSLQKMERQSQLIAEAKAAQEEECSLRKSRIINSKSYLEIDAMQDAEEEESQDATVLDMESRKRARHTSVLDGLDESLSLWMDKLASNDSHAFPNLDHSPSSSPPHSPPTLSLSSSSIAGSPLSSSVSQLEPTFTSPTITSVSLPRFFTGGAQALVGNFREDLELTWDGDITPTSPYFSPSSELTKSISTSTSFTSSTSPTLAPMNSPPLTSTSISTTKAPLPLIRTLTSSSASVEEFFEDDLWEKSSDSFIPMEAEWELIDSPSFELNSHGFYPSVGNSSISLGGTIVTASVDGSEIGFLSSTTTISQNGGGVKVKPRKLQKRSHSGRQV